MNSERSIEKTVHNKQGLMRCVMPRIKVKPSATIRNFRLYLVNDVEYYC